MRYTLRMTQDQFEALWTLEEMPFCPIGMKLLRLLTEKNPAVVDHLPGLLYQRSSLPFADDPDWLQLLNHANECADCSES
jgi:hypothetical protein